MRFGDVADTMHGRQCRQDGAAELRVVETTSEQVEADDNEGQPSDFGRGHQALTRNRVERFAP